MTALFPPLSINHSEMLNTDDGHSLYVETSGNPNGIPVLCLHGGPGAGMSDDYRRLFNPHLYFIIGMDQRGSGRSTPFASLENNTTAHLLADIRMLRKHLNIEQWVLFGGSWGATLALLAAIDDPVSVKAMVLRGIFLAREQDRYWFLSKEGGAAQIFTEHYQKFIEPVGEHDDVQALCEAYYQAMTCNDEVHKMAAVRAWCGWEERISRLQHPHGDPLEHDNVHRAISLALMECHYLKHHCFVSENAIINHIDKIKHIPGTIIQGRYDIVCKMEAAHTLSEHWPNSRLLIVPDAGHSASEPSIAEALVKANEAMAAFLQESSI
ncbi:prolyl aminopeptidase [Aestuariibacter salexigens]|uniref:prolyl aminopeptidase n=1 Tax=Aestuariibacter salexigens TaxID=226010 RepID=UPI0004171DB0|nr:prolyl aminopeptidase [Aestuariibacter salexigens]